MVQAMSYLNVADNSGAKRVQCIKVLGGTRHVSAGVGDRIVVTVKTAIPSATVRKGTVVRAVIVRTRKETLASTAPYIRFDDTFCV